MIPKDTEADILRLFHAEKWPVGTIARQLGVHHTTVQRVLQQTGVAIAAVTPRPSMADPFLPFIVEQLEKYAGLRASRLFQMIKERGYQGGPDHFRVVGRYRPRKPAEAFQRLKTLAGEQAQVDWAHFGKVQVGRAERVLWAFVMVLSFSRQVFVRFFLGASMPFFVRGHVQAFEFFGGVPRVLL
jgi:transposase